MRKDKINKGNYLRKKIKKGTKANQLKQKKRQEGYIHSLGQVHPWNLSNASLTIMDILVE